MTEDTKLKFYKDLASLQAEIPPIKKNCTVKSGAFQFEYADLTAIMDVLRPLLGKYKFAISHWIEGKEDRQYLVTNLIHESGNLLRSSCLLPPNPNMQRFGGEITFLKRYQINALLNISSDIDLDEFENAENASPNKMSKKLSQAQVDEILKLAKAKNEMTRVENFLKRKKLKSLAQVEAEYFNMLKNWIEGDKKND